MSQKEKQYVVPIPASTDPNLVGELVREALEKNYAVTISEGTARSITMVAVDNAEKKKPELSEIVFHFGPSWFGCTYKWKK